MSADLHQGRIVLNEWVGRRYKHMVVEAPDAVVAVPGQFFHLRLSSQWDPLLRRPMSIYGIDEDRGWVEFLYHVRGRGTALLAGLVPGDTLDLLGPLGRGFSLDSAWRGILLVGRGAGLATLAPLAEQAVQSGMDVFAILSARTPDRLVSVDRLHELGARVATVTDVEGTSEVHVVESMVREILHRESVDAVFTCGSRRLTKLMQRLADTHGIPGQVALEENMGCGLGMCYCCVKPFFREGRVYPLRVCREGPVFSLAEVIVDEL
ncbi:dihydroorotate dehydrogenase electron transfer subunit [Kyrpidia spormannii]|uniref:Dihydroorotate dehydrogenase electron transfer subunit n=2 Tax=Kyrpidia spormannii TaxID=2055160 RepID=A0ACA8ZDR1_9BACL|nr:MULTISPECIES: dihydroorotate dehydrogenase electron transfer subunit [Kyrpidia]ATY85142.1 dihydroorotate dehydrogenase electron transfer subunit [Kyrpidia spormannii]MCL6575762.1 dihydroorotate dehydrogenase electron transfer subunit [Kyrpidia sp.]CAB3392778.1 Dihydroorotate dehydrogenase electron transfer subunit [Kyrpidia spormannii]